MDEIHDLIAGLVQPAAARPVGELLTIQLVVADKFGIRVEEMWSERRARRVARPRQVAMYLARELTSYSLPRIGRHFGDRDHTTVMHALRVVEALCADDPAFAATITELQAILAAQIEGDRQ
jgi:chromosomal replication initiator protein